LETLIASPKKWPGQGGTTTEGGVPPLAPLVQGPTIRHSYRGGGGGTEISRWCKQKKKEKTKVKRALNAIREGPNGEW